MLEGKFSGVVNLQAVGFHSVFHRLSQCPQCPIRADFLSHSVNICGFFDELLGSYPIPIFQALNRVWPAQNADRKEQNRAQQLKNTSHRDSQNSQGQQQQPNNGV